MRFRSIVLIATLALGIPLAPPAAPLASFAQQPQGKIPRIGFLIAETLSGQASRVEALRAGLRDLGYVEGKGIAIEVRSADGNYDRLPELAAELTRLKVDVLVAFVVAYLLNPANATSALILPGMRASAKSLKLELQPFEVRAPKEFGGTFSAMAKGRVDAVLVSTDTLFASSAKEIAELAAKQRLPTAGGKEFAEAGGLIGYGANDAELYRRGAYFVDRILKGAKPADLPVEQAMKFELVVNLKTAKALGLTIPQSVLIRADEVIQ
ncbi:MAG TPA: ABC transporter substrate-binding protein [Candidatus Methylomirabilis sp.]|nr:ABC transporter substrate-binding protein [Candidatus Methylomirabilis sp.]